MSPLTWSLIAAGVVVLLVVGLVLVSTVAAKVAGSLPSASATPNRTAEPATVPSPDAEQRRVYLKMLEMVEPGLVAKPDRAVSRGRDVCLDIREGKGETTILKNVRERFTGGDVEVSLTEAKRIVIAVQVWCQL